MSVLLISRLIAWYFILAAPLLMLPPVTVQTRTSLALEVNLRYGDEDQEAVPVAADFYLLDASLIEILKAARFRPVFPDQKNRRITDRDYLEAAAATLIAGGAGDDSDAAGGKDEAEVEAAAFLISDLLRKHSSSVIKTNRLGDGRLLAGSPGKRFLFGIGQSGGQTVVWHLPVVIKAGFNEINLDQNDAELVF